MLEGPSLNTSHSQSHHIKGEAGIKGADQNNMTPDVGNGMDYQQMLAISLLNEVKGIDPQSIQTNPVNSNVDGIA
ncbi:MAG: hypothetical protein O3A01_07200 [bacterium]|nr:hypothetical protein [bacterium]